MISGGFKRKRAATRISGYEQSATDFLSMTQIVDTTISNAVDKLVRQYKDNGLWTLRDAIWPMVGGVELSHKINLKDPRDLDAAFRLSFLGGGWVHSANGAMPNGSSSYANTFINPSVVRTATNGFMGFYSGTSELSLSGSDMGSRVAGSAEVLLHIRNLAGVFHPVWDDLSTATSTFVPGHTLGWFAINRTTGDQEGWINGVKELVISGNGGVPNQVVTMCASNTDGTPANFGTKQCRFAVFGGTLTDAQNLKEYEIIQEFQTDLSRNV